MPWGIYPICPVPKTSLSKYQSLCAPASFVGQRRPSRSPFHEKRRAENDAGDSSDLGIALDSVGPSMVFKCGATTRRSGLRKKSFTWFLRGARATCRMCVYDFEFAALPDKAAVAGIKRSVRKTGTGEGPMVNCVGSNNSPSTCKFTICCGITPRL